MKNSSYCCAQLQIEENTIGARLSTIDLHGINRRDLYEDRATFPAQVESVVFGKCQSDYKAPLFFVYVRGIASRRRLARSSSRVSR